jgi:hypothetical protein
MIEMLTPHVRKKQKIFTQMRMSRTKTEQRPRCSARCKGRMGIETESERGSDKATRYQIGLVCAGLFCDCFFTPTLLSCRL